jgi:hypothetical protein
MQLLIINGTATSGKDQFVKLFKNHYQHKCYNWSTIDKVKKIARKHFGWDGTKSEEARLFLSELKLIWNEYNNGPFQYMAKKIAKHYRKLKEDEKNTVIYFIHCREIDEIQKLVALYQGKCQTILIKRNYIIVPDNKSDRNVENYSYDYIIENNGDLFELENKAKCFVSDLTKKVIHKNV